MKKIIFTLLFLGTVSAGGLFAYNFYINPATDNSNINQDSELSQDLAEIDSLLNPDENSEEDNEDLLSPEDLFEADEFISDESDSGKRKVPSLTQQKIFENSFIRFSHPGFVSFQKETVNFLEIWNQEKSIGTINIYDNPENISIAEFVKRDNLVNYFEEAKIKGVENEEFEVPTAREAFVFREFPGIELMDVYLVSFDKVFVLVKDYSDDKVVGEYLVRSMEKSE
jgi:hypothetical protein